MRETPERLPYEPMDERQRAIDMVRELDVTKDGDVFDLIARLLRDKDRIEWLGDAYGPYKLQLIEDCWLADDHTPIREAIDAARKADA